MYNPNLNLVFTVENQVKGWEIYEANTSYSLMSLLLRLVQILYSRLCSETSRVGSCLSKVLVIMLYNGANSVLEP